MLNNQDSLRRATDELRSAVTHSALSTSEALSQLADRAHEPGGIADVEDLHRGGTLHMCPWSTCQATRHG